MERNERDIEESSDDHHQDERSVAEAEVAAPDTSSFETPQRRGSTHRDTIQRKELAPRQLPFSKEKTVKGTKQSDVKDRAEKSTKEGVDTLHQHEVEVKTKAKSQPKKPPKEPEPTSPAIIQPPPYTKGEDLLVYHEACDTLCKGNENDTIITIKCPEGWEMAEVFVTRESWGTLNKSQELDSLIVNAALSVVFDDYRTTSQSDVFVFNADAYHSANFTTCVDNVTQAQDLIQKKMWVIPIWVPSGMDKEKKGGIGHWYCVVVDLSNMTLYPLNSLRGQEFDGEVESHCRNLVQNVFQLAGEDCRKITVKPTEVPEQTDGVSCGLCTILNIHYFIHRKPIKYSTSFEVMSNFRDRLKKCLLAHDTSVQRLERSCQRETVYNTFDDICPPMEDETEYKEHQHEPPSVVAALSCGDQKESLHIVQASCLNHLDKTPLNQDQLEGKAPLCSPTHAEQWKDYLPELASVLSGKKVPDFSLLEDQLFRNFQKTSAGGKLNWL